jgi:hypothetical protein
MTAADRQREDEDGDKKEIRKQETLSVSHVRNAGAVL